MGFLTDALEKRAANFLTRFFKPKPRIGAVRLKKAIASPNVAGVSEAAAKPVYQYSDPKLQKLMDGYSSSITDLMKNLREATTPKG